MNKALGIGFLIAMVAYPAAALAESYRSDEYGLRFVVPRTLGAISPLNLPDPYPPLRDPIDILDAVVFRTISDVNEDPEAQLLGVWVAPEASLVAALYPANFNLQDSRELGVEVEGAFYQTHYLYSADPQTWWNHSENSIRRIGSHRIGYKFEQFGLQDTPWDFSLVTAVMEAGEKVLVLRFTALTAIDHPDVTHLSEGLPDLRPWLGFTSEVERCLRSVRLEDGRSGVVQRWALTLFMLALLGGLAVKLYFMVTSRREEEEDEEYEQALEQAFRKRYTINTVGSRGDGSGSTGRFEFPPKVKGRIERRDLPGALELSRQLLAVAQEMKDPRSESLYRECITRIEAMAGRGIA